MRLINAKFNGVCAETGAKIRKGDLCLYDPIARKVYAKGVKIGSSNQDADFIQANEDAYFDNFCQQNNL